MGAIAQAEAARGAQEAVARVGTYLQCLGLPGVEAKTQAEHLVAVCAATAPLDPEGLAAAALDRAMAHYAALLDRLCAEAGRGVSCSRGVLAWHLRAALATHPDALLGETDTLPEGVRSALRAAAQPPVPPESPTAMPDQSFGVPPRVLRAGFWLSLGRMARQAWRDAIGGS